MTDAAEIDAQSSALMQALQDGSDAALAGLIGLWQEPLLRFVFRYVQSETEAREIVHEAFVRVHTQRMKFRGEQSFRSWVLTIAANLARNRRRWWRRHPSAAWRRMEEVPPSEAACPAPAPDHALMKQERVQAVRAAVESLPHELKVALLLHEYEDLGYREIATVLGCTERGVETRLTRARERMRAELGKFLRTEERPVAVAAH